MGYKFDDIYYKSAIMYISIATTFGYSKFFYKPLVCKIDPQEVLDILRDQFM